MALERIEQDFELTHDVFQHAHWGGTIGKKLMSEVDKEIIDL